LQNAHAGAPSVPGWQEHAARDTGARGRPHRHGSAQRANLFLAAEAPMIVKMQLLEPVNTDVPARL